MASTAVSPAVRTTSSAWTGWLAFAGWMMIVVGGIDFFEGLIAVIRGHYYLLTATQIIVFDVSTWGWIMLIWGVILVLVGLALTAGRGWARWVSIIVVSANIFGQLGFLGNSQYPLWAITVLVLNVIVLYALTVRWHESAMDLGATT